MVRLRDPLVALAAVVVLAGLLGALQQWRQPEERKPPKPAKPYPSRAATLPPAVDVIDEPEGFEATRDVMPGRLELPSGRLAIDGFFVGDTKPLPRRVAPGAYPFHITEAKPVRGGGGDRVALATLVVSERPTVRWQPAGGIGVDGGVAAFSSAEGASNLGSDDADSSLDRQLDTYDVMDAHGGGVGLTNVSDKTNIAVFQTGLGDGGYGIYVGLDDAGAPTRFVLDCGLIHFDWPEPEGPKATQG